MGERRHAPADGSTRRVRAVRSVLPLVAWTSGLAAVLVGAVSLGSVPALAGPPLAGPGELASWAAGRSPIEGAFAVLRLAVVCLAAHLLLGTGLAVVARALRSRRLLALVDVVTSSWIRHVVELALGAGLLTAPLGPMPAGAAAASTITASVVLPEVSGGQELEPIDDPVVAPQQGPPTMRRLDAPEPVGGGPSEVVIGPGDHLWSVAERALAAAWGRAPGDAEVAPFWEQVVEVNRARLADPSNPDLVFPGQVVAVPVPPPARPA